MGIPWSKNLDGGPHQCRLASMPGNRLQLQATKFKSEADDVDAM